MLGRGADALGGWIIDHRRPLLKIGAWAGGIVAVPVVALYLLPYVLGLFAPTLDLSQDLYAVNRPVASPSWTPRARSPAAAARWSASG